MRRRQERTARPFAFVRWWQRRWSDDQPLTVRGMVAAAAPATVYYNVNQFGRRQLWRIRVEPVPDKEVNW